MIHQNHNENNVRHLIVGDVHSCLQELQVLLSKANYVQGIDKLIIAGDLIDRGPNPSGTLRFLKEIGADIVLGNHDQKFLRWVDYEARIKSGAISKNPMQEPNPVRREEWLSIDQELIDWLAHFPYWMRFTVADKRWIVVHGGLELGKPVEEQDPKKLCRVRYLLNNGRMAHMARSGETQQGKLWSECWDQEENVVCGHAVHSLTDIRVDRNQKGGTVYSIDTGSCFGGRLTALEITSIGGITVHQVQSHAQYAKLPLTPYE